MRDSVGQAAGEVSAPVSDLTGDMPQLFPSDGGGLEPWMTGCCRLISAWAAMSPDGLMEWFTGDWVGNMFGLCGEHKRDSYFFLSASLQNSTL